MRRRSFVVGGLALLGVPAVAAEPAPARLSFRDLFSGRLLFDPDGRPLLPVGMMEGQRRVAFTLPAGGEVILDGEGEVRAVDVPASGAVVVERVSGQAAAVEDGWVLQTLEGEARGGRREAVARWREVGLEPRLKLAGGVYGMRGTVVDNRAALVVTGAEPSAKEREEHGLRPVRMRWLQGLPQARLRVTAGGVAHAAQDLVEVRPRGGWLVAHGVEHSIGYPQHGFADRELRGRSVVAADRRGLLALVNVVREDDLVAGILPSEMFSSAPLEALKAQAVTARGEVYAKIGRRHLTDPYLVCSSQHCQVYRGKSAEQEKPTRAARATAGELAFHGGHLVDSVYSACCGGHTEPAHIVWDRPPKDALIGTVDAPFADPATRPWVKAAGQASVAATDLVENGALDVTGVPIDLSQEEAVRRFLALDRGLTFCGRSSFNQKGDAYRWTRRFSAAELTRAFADLGVGPVTRIAIEERGPGGRLRALVIEGEQGRAEVLRELPVRRRLAKGKAILKSGLFVIDEERGPAGRLVAVTLRGAGYGHGSGMCQQGAIGMAEAGFSYAEILRHYYGGAEVKKVF